jgi:DNA helicase-2/ATP-dependent DNA helicase PcrA
MDYAKPLKEKPPSSKFLEQLRMTDSVHRAFFDKVILNPVQRDAVAYMDGPQLVFAGAGTGKTRVLTAKIAYLIQHEAIHPSRILAATFTNKAAREMRERVQSLTGLDCGALWIGTFHSLCVRILRRDGVQLGYDPYFSIFDSDDQRALIRKIMRSLEIDERSMTIGAVHSAISSFKNSCTKPPAVHERAAGYYDQQIARIYQAYQETLRAQQAMDFDDLITNTVYLLRENEMVRGKWQRMFEYVLVDEYQDTNQAQFHLVKLLAQGHQKIFAVGDDDQSIYGWRGAQVENILKFEEFFNGTRVFKLEQNYRSSQAILDFANAAITPNTARAQKKLWTSREGGEPVRLIRYADDRQEAEASCVRVGQLLANNVKATDILVLFRTNAQSRAFEDAFRKRNIPYVLVGGLSFYQRREIKDSLSYLRLLANPHDDVSFERIMNLPPRGLGAKSAEALALIARNASLSQLQAILGGRADAIGGRAQKGIDELKELFSTLTGLAKSGTSPIELMQEILTLSGYMDMLQSEDEEEARNRVENVNELLNLLGMWSQEHPEGSLIQFLEEISLVSDVDSLDEVKERVALMTLHSAKGLEAQHVFLAGIEEGIIPSRQNFDDPNKVDEERRLFYVGITRAMKALYCSFVDRRWRFGSVTPMECSRFVQSIPRTLYQPCDESIVFNQSVQHSAAPMVRGTPRGVVRPGSTIAPPSRPGAARPAPARTGTIRPPAQTSPQPLRKPQAAPQQDYDDFSQENVQLRIGQHVRHKTYGTGRILGISGFGADTRITVLFNDGSRRKLMAQFANLQPM